MQALRKTIWPLFITLLSLRASAQFKPVPLEPPSQINPHLYNPAANATLDIRHAIVTAAKEHKNVLLDFGGNWCIDCHILDNAFHQPRIAPLLNDNYVLVHVNVGQYDKNLEVAKKYHADLSKGVPSLSVLDAHGTVIYATKDFERARVLSQDDVIHFLDKWKPRRAAK